MTQYKVTMAVNSLDPETLEVSAIRRDVSNTLFNSPREAIEDYLKALANPFANDIKIESVEV